MKVHLIPPLVTASFYKPKPEKRKSIL